MKQFELRKYVLNVSRRGTSTECEMIVAPQSQKQASENDYKKLSLFAEECCRNLKQCVERLYAKFPRLTRVIFQLRIGKGQRFIKVSIEISHWIGFKSVVRGRNAIELAQKLVDTFSARDLNFKSLSTEEGVHDFKSRYISPVIKKYEDACDVLNVEVITSERIVWQAREFMKARYRTRDRCLIVIVLGAGERIHTNLRQLKNSQKTYLRQLNPLFQQYCDLMKSDATLFAYPLANLVLQRTKATHVRSHAFAKYSNDLEHHIGTIGNLRKTDKPMFLLEQKNCESSPVANATHEFFYVWSASLHSALTQHMYLRIFKFGVTSISCDKVEADVAVMENAVRKRSGAYARDHSLEISDMQVELMSRPESISLTEVRQGLQFETWLKNKTNNKLLLNSTYLSSDLPTTEIMISDHFNEIDAIQYILAVAKKNFPELDFYLSPSP